MGNIYLPNNLKILRNKRNKSQKDIALLVNKLHTAISSWENGLSEPSLKELTTLSDYFGVGIGELIGVDLSKPIEPPTVGAPLFNSPIEESPLRTNLDNGNDIIERKGIPLIPFHAIKDFCLSDDNPMEYDTDRYWVLPYFKEAHFLITIHGDSMVPLLKSGDYAICSIVKDITKIEWGRAYVIDTGNEILFKYVEEGLDKEHFYVISENPTYKPFQILASSIRSLALVIGIVRRD